MHVRVNVRSPKDEIVIASEPLVAFVPDQSFEAVQDSAEVEDQDKSSVLLSSIELAATIVTVGADNPPPPQAFSNMNEQKMVTNFIENNISISSSL